MTASATPLKVSLLISAEGSNAVPAIRNTKTELAGLREATGQTSNATRTLSAANDQSARAARGAMEATRGATTITKSFSGALSNAATQAALFHGPLGGIASRFVALNTLLKSSSALWGSVALAIGITGVALGKAALGYEEHERSGRRLAAVLKATGQSSGLALEDIRGFSRELALATLASTQGVETAAAKLLTFRSIAGKTFKDTLVAAQDLAAAGFGTIEQNAVQLGKALENPVEGLTALTRVGVSFTASQKELIRQLVETGRVAEAQKVVLAAIASQVGGTGAGEAQGLSGSFDTLSQRVEEFWIALGDRTGAGARFADLLNVLSAGLDATSKRLSPDLFGNSGEQMRALGQDRLRVEREILELQDRQREASGALAEAERRILEGQIVSRREALEEIAKQEELILGTLKKQQRERQEAADKGEEARRQAEEDRLADNLNKRRKDLDEVLGQARLELDLLGLSVAETERRRMIETALLEARKKGVELSEQELAAITAAAAEYGRLRALIAAREVIRGGEEEIELRRTELSLMGESRTARDAVIAQLQTEQEIRRLGIDLYGAEAQKMRENTAALSELAEAAARGKLRQDLIFQREQLGRSPDDRRIATTLQSAGLPVDLSSYEAGLIRSNLQLEKMNETWESIADVGGKGIDSLVDALFDGGKDIGDVLMGIGRNFARLMFDLAVTNPLKNALFGGNKPTLDDAGGIGGILSRLFGGGKAEPSTLPGAGIGSTGAMNVTAASVIVNGGVGGTLGGAAQAPFDRIFGAANSNASGGLSKMAAYAQAIKDIESGGGNYSALGPITKSGDRAYGAYQVMGANIPSWTKSALGQSMTPTQFLGDKGAQDRVFEKVFGGYVSKYGNPQDAASAWFTGRPQSQGANATDILGTSGSGYVAKFNTALEKMGSTAAGAAQNLGTFGNDLGQMGKNLSNYFPPAPSGGGGGGGLGGVFGSLFGGLRGGLASSAQASSLLASGAVGLFSEGGHTGPGGKFDPAGIVHAEEYVFSREATRAIGVSNLDKLHRNARRGFAEGGYAGPYMPANSNTQSASGSGPLVVINNNSSAQITQREESDGRGGRRLVMELSDMVADGMSRPGSSLDRAMGRRGAKQALTRR